VGKDAEVDFGRGDADASFGTSCPFPEDDLEGRGVGFEELEEA
jgi:hypothetical protein